MKLRIGSYLDDKGLQQVRAALVLREEEWIWVADHTVADVWLSDVDRQVGVSEALQIEVPCSILVTATVDQLQDLAEHQFVLAAPLRSGHVLRLLDKALQGVDERRQRQQVARDAREAAEQAALQAEYAKQLEAERTIRQAKAAEEERKARARAEAAAQLRHAELEDAAAQGDRQAAELIANGAHPWVGRNIMFKGKPDFSRFPITVELVVWLQEMEKAPVSYDDMLTHLPMDRELMQTVLNAAANEGELVDEFGTPLPPTEVEKKKTSVLGRLMGGKGKKS